MTLVLQDDRAVGVNHARPSRPPPKQHEALQIKGGDVILEEPRDPQAMNPQPETPNGPPRRVPEPVGSIRPNKG